MHIYVSSSFWKSSKRSGWRFLVDEERGGRLLTLETNKTFDNLRLMVCEDFAIDVNMSNSTRSRGICLLFSLVKKTHRRKQRNIIRCFVSFVSYIIKDHYNILLLSCIINRIIIRIFRKISWSI